MIEGLQNHNNPHINGVLKARTLINCARLVVNNVHTSNLKRAALPPKMEEAKCSQKRMETPDERKAPK